MQILCLWTLVFVLTTANAMEDLYCGDMDCYQVLGVERDNINKGELGKIYRKMAGKVHPDRFKNEKDKEIAEKKFMQIAAAYEVLKDDESRSEYDYMLDHPEEMWQNYYRYYRRRMTPKIDVRIVIAVTITVISAVQYFASWNNYEEAIKYLLTVPKYRIQAIEIARDNGLIKNDKEKKVANKGKSKEKIKEEEESIIRQVILENMDIRGGHAKPSLVNILWVQIILLPLTIYKWLYFYCRWFFKFVLLRQNYGKDEKLYIIRKNMTLSKEQFEDMSEEEHEIFLEQELWIPENFNEWKQNKEDEKRIKMASSGRYKQYRRYMKNHGSDRMTFDDS